MKITGIRRSAPHLDHPGLGSHRAEQTRLRVSHAGKRPAWPTYIRNIHRAPYIFIELK